MKRPSFGKYEDIFSGWRRVIVLEANEKRKSKRLYRRWERRQGERELWKSGWLG